MAARENWATIASLVETCKLVGHNPHAYLADVLARIVTRRDGEPLDDLLPGRWVDTKAAETTPNVVTSLKPRDGNAEQSN